MLNSWKWWVNGAAYGGKYHEVKSDVQVHFIVTGNCLNESMHMQLNGSFYVVYVIEYDLPIFAFPIRKRRSV